MKHLKLFMMLFLLGILLNSCQEDDINFDLTESQSIETREIAQVNSEFDIEDYKGCFNDMMTRVKKKTFEEQYGEPSEVSIRYKNKNGIWSIYPILKNDTITTLFWINGKNDGYIIPKDAKFSNEIINESIVTKGVSNLFELDKSDLQTTSLESAVRQKLGIEYSIQKNANVLEINELNDSNSTIGVEVGAKSISKMCDNTQLADLYYIMFGFHDESGQFPDYVFDQSIMIDAINSIINVHGGYCICPIPCYLQKVLNEREDIPQSIKDQLNSNMVLSELDFTFVSSLSSDEFNTLASLMGRGGCQVFWECGQSDFTCIIDKIECLNRLEDFEINEGLTVNSSTFDDIIFNSDADICSLVGNDFDEAAYEQIFINSTLYDEEYISPELNLCTVLSCFDEPRDATTIYKVTIHSDQPKSGSRSTWAYNDGVDVGHSFITLEIITGTTIKRLSFGFYPDGGIGVKEESDKQADGIIYDETLTGVGGSSHSFDVSLTWTLSESEFDNLISNLENFGCNANLQYHLDNYNCTDFATQVVNTIGLNVPDTYGSWPKGGGSNPGDLGEDLRSMSLSTNMTLNSAGGTVLPRNCD